MCSTMRQPFKLFDSAQLRQVSTDQQNKRPVRPVRVPALHVRLVTAAEHRLGQVSAGAAKLVPCSTEIGRHGSQATATHARLRHDTLKGGHHTRSVVAHRRRSRGSPCKRLEACDLTNGRGADRPLDRAIVAGLVIEVPHEGPNRGRALFASERDKQIHKLRQALTSTTSQGRASQIYAELNVLLAERAATWRDQ